MHRGKVVVGVVAVLAAGFALIRPRGEAGTVSTSSPAAPAPAAQRPAEKGGGGFSFGGGGGRKVEVARPRRGPIASHIEAPGTVRAGSETGVGAPFEGRVLEIVKDEGDPVEKGEVLFRLDPTEHGEKVQEAELALKQKQTAAAEADAERGQAERRQEDSGREPSEVTEARLRAKQSELSSQRAQAQLESARSKLDRARQMRAQGIGTPIDVETAESEHRVAEIGVRIAAEELGLAKETLAFRERTWAENRADAQKNLAVTTARAARAVADRTASEVALARARRDLERCDVKATLTGVVTARGLNLGDQVIRATGDVTHYIISDLARLVVYADVAEGDVVRCAQGQASRAKVTALGDDVILTGRVYDVGMRATTKQGQDASIFRVRVLLDAGQAAAARLRPGMSATVEVETARADAALKVPLQAIVQRELQALPEAVRAAAPKAATEGKRPSDLVDVVFVVEGGKAKAHVVVRGIQDEDEAALDAPLDEAQVVTGPFRTLEKLADGDQVTSEPSPIELPPDPKPATEAAAAPTKAG